MEMQQVLQLAIGAAGPAGNSKAAWRERVVDLSVEISEMFDPESATHKRIRSLLEAHKFVGTVVGVEIEESSTRGIVSIDTGNVTKDAPEGIEKLRTDRGDTRRGAEMIRTINGLVGHRVLVYKVMETSRQDPNTKVRVLARVADLGMPRPS